MKLGMSFVGEVRCIAENQYKKDDGGIGTSYKVGVELMSGEMGQVACTSDLAMKFGKSIQKGDVCEFIAEFNTDYKRLQVLDATKID